MALSTVPDGPSARVLGLNEREWKDVLHSECVKGQIIQRSHEISL